MAHIRQKRNAHGWGKTLKEGDILEEWMIMLKEMLKK
jgi:hypothetical protein